MLRAQCNTNFLARLWPLCCCGAARQTLQCLQEAISPHADCNTRYGGD